MRLQRRNVTKFEYLPYTGTETDLNEDGEHTGDYEREYGRPVKMEGNISTPSGHVSQTFYGDDIRYTHTLVMDNPNPGIDEYGQVLWKGKLYSVEAVRPSINSVSIALRRITVDHADGDGQ